MVHDDSFENAKQSLRLRRYSLQDIKVLHAENAYLLLSVADMVSVFILTCHITTLEDECLEVENSRDQTRTASLST